jgi:hypothetical protein
MKGWKDKTTEIQQRGKLADVDKELLILTYQCQKLKKALLSTITKMKGWKDKTTEI